jgi:hypothetical protein
MTICDTFKRLALNTWDSINQSRSVNFQLKEETFTDINMLSIKRNHPLDVKTKVFPKHEEGQNGADWEWWFGNRKSQWVGFRVQAKILNIEKDRFDHLHYKSTQTAVFQTDKLIERSITRHYPKMPLYCLYLQTNDRNRLTTWSCQSFPLISDLWGCSLVSAFSVRYLRSTRPFRNHLSDLEPYLKPWHCLVCCAGYGGNGFIERIDKYRSANFAIDSEALAALGVSMPNTFLIERPPQYVLNIIENETNDNIIAEDEDLSGVFIYTVDDEKSSDK